MIFLPNFFDIYTAKLRFTVQKFINKNGNKQKYINMLKKINLAEAIYHKDELEPINIKSEIFTLINEPSMHKAFSVIVDINGNFLLNKKLFIILILSLLSRSGKIEIFDFLGQIVIVSKSKTNSVKKLITSLNGYYFFEKSTNNLILVINAYRTEKEAIKTNKDWLNSSNPYSLINLFLQ